MDLRDQAKEIISAAIEAVKPDRLIRESVRRAGEILRIGEQSFNLNRFEKIFVIGAGKASAPMAREMENVLGERLTDGMVTVKYGHGQPCRKIKIREASHPVIDQNGLSASEQILQMVDTAGKNDLVICLISGGGSALLEKLPEGISLSDLQKLFELLLNCGATIDEINTVRKHLSLVKGGQLARAIAPATCLSLILSDVIGDPLESIASGPTAPDPTTFSDAWQVIEKYRLESALPASIGNYLKKGVAGEAPETLKPGDPIFRNVHNLILGNNLKALQAAREKAKEFGYQPLILTSRVQGEAREVARVLAAMVQDVLTNALPVSRPACLLLGGETTVTLRGKGKGGRNQELALAALLTMKNFRKDYLIVSCGTDGTDGPTDAAGGMASPQVWENARAQGVDPLPFLENNDAYHFFRKTGGLIMTGPTGTNVMDIILALIP